MYKLFTANYKTEKLLQEYIASRRDIKEKIERLKLEPRRVNGAHPLHGRLAGKWSCWLGYNLRMIYSIDDKNNRVVVEAVGTHKVY